MKLSALLILCAVLTLQVSARTFTNTKGKELVAEITTADHKSVTLKLSSGKFSKIQLSQLSAADQEFVQNWIAQQLPKLRVTPQFVRSNRVPRATATSPEVNGERVQVLELSVHFESWDEVRDIKDAELKYILVGRSMSQKERYKILAVQRAEFSVEPAGETTVDFKKVNNFYDDNPSAGKGARCVGYVLYATRKSDGRTIYASASSPILKKHLSSIATFNTGEEVDNNFIKIPDPDESESITVK